MTFSIVARSDDGTQWGVAVASKFLAAGAFVPAARAGLGAMATQSFVNLRYVPDGFALLEAGRAASDVLTALTGGDDDRDQRQIGLVDAAGTAAAFTGAGCIPWAGSAIGPGHSAQGNCLAGPDVVANMSAAFLAADPSGPLAHRLLAALSAGELAGGDRRGRQSAALLVVSPGAGYGGGGDVAADLRVDDHTDPVAELARLLGLHDLYFTKADPADLLPLTGSVADEVDALLLAAGYDAAHPLPERLLAWMGWENYEERDVPGFIDPVVLHHLRTNATRPMH